MIERLQTYDEVEFDVRKADSECTHTRVLAANSVREGPVPDYVIASDLSQQGTVPDRHECVPSNADVRAFGDVGAVLVVGRSILRARGARNLHEIECDLWTN